MKSFKNFLIETYDDRYQPWFINFKYNLDNLSESYELKAKKKDLSSYYFHIGNKKFGGYENLKSNIKSIFGPNTSIKDLKFRIKPTPEPNLFNNEKQKTEKENKFSTKRYETSSKLKQHYNKWTNDEQSYLKKYTEGSFSLNRYLFRKAKDPNLPHDIYEEEQASILDNAMQRHKLPHDIVVYSGLKRSPEQMREVFSAMDGKHFRVHLPAFTSTSLHRKKAMDFAKEEKTQSIYGSNFKHYLTLKIPKGSHGAYVEDLSNYQNEHEFIIPRDSKIHIMAKPKVVPEMNAVHWYGRLVYDGSKPTKAHKPLQLSFFKFFKPYQKEFDF